MTKTTAIVRKKLSAPAQWLYDHCYLNGPKRILDYGSGRGFDAAFLRCESYDPNWGPSLPAGYFDIILCTYVLNVLGSDEMHKTLHHIKSRLRCGGIAYISVRRDIKEPTPGRNCIQWPIQLPLPSVTTNSKFEIYKLLESEG